MTLYFCTLLKAPKTSRVHVGKSSRSPSGAPQQTPGNQWENIIKFLDSLMSQLRENHVSVANIAFAFLVACVFHCM